MLERFGGHKVRCKVCGFTDRVHPEVELKHIRRTHCGLTPDERGAMHRKGQFTLLSTYVPPPPTYDCIYRGPEIRRQPCEECTGKNVQIKVFGCRTYGECILSNKDPGIQSCVMCQTRVDLKSKPLIQNRHKPVGAIYKPAPMLLRPQSNLCVLSIAIGDRTNELFQMTQPLMQAYAERCGADFIVLQDQTQDWFMFEKFRLREVLPWYERICYFDADVLVQPNAPSLFDVVPRGRLGLYNDAVHFTSYRLQFEREWKALMVSQGYDMPCPQRAFNTGVILIDREHLPMYEPPARPTPEHWCDEQHHQQYRLESLGYPVFELPDALNWQYWWPRFGSISAYEQAAREQGQIIHLAGCPHHVRLELSRRLRPASASPSLLPPAPD